MTALFIAKMILNVILLLMRTFHSRLTNMKKCTNLYTLISKVNYILTSEIVELLENVLHSLMGWSQVIYGI